MKILGKEYSTFQYGDYLWMTQNLDAECNGAVKLGNTMYYPYSAINVINFGCTDGWHVPTEADAVTLMTMCRCDLQGANEKYTQTGYRLGLDYNGIVTPEGNLVGYAMFGCFLVDKIDKIENNSDVQLNYILMTRGATELTFGSCYKRNKIAIRLCKKV